MKLDFKKVSVLILCLIYSFTFNFNTVFAKTVDSGNNANNFKIVINNDEECTVMAEDNGDELYATLNKTTNEITMKSIEKPKGKTLMFSVDSAKEKKKTYKVKVDNRTKNNLSGTIVDNDTNKEFKLNSNSDKVTAQVPILVPLAEIVGAALIDYLLTIAAIIVVSGVTYYAATKVIEKIRNNNNYDYYAAYTVPGDDVYIAGPISYSVAVGRLMSGIGNDVFARTSTKASNAARAAGGGRTPVGPEIGSGSGKQYSHFHVYNRLYGTHSFFASFA